MTRLRSLTCLVRLLVTAVLMSAPGTAWADCQIKFTDHNYNRHVYGSINAECSWESGGIHSIDGPWGNWGVDSPHGGRFDGYQFPGWENRDDWEQWNSCTSEYPPPSGTYYNYNNGYEQFTDWNPVAHFATYWTDPLPWPCSDYGTIYTIPDFFMSIFELDWDGDDGVAIIDYPSFDIALSCNNGYCSGDTQGWIVPWSVHPDVLTGWLWMSIEMWDV